MPRNSVILMRPDQRHVCPKCQAENIDRGPHAKPTIELEQNGTLTCTVCGHNWPIHTGPTDGH
jgi:ribosomal protein L37AE/L43A